MEIFFPFLLAGFGMVLAGLLLDFVQNWKVFQECSELFILVPALLGLKALWTKPWRKYFENFEIIVSLGRKYSETYCGRGQVT